MNTVDVGWVKRQRNPTKLNHKITKTLGNIIQMQFPEVQINKTKCPKKLEN